MKALLLVAFLLPVTPACIWIDGTSIDGGHVSVGGQRASSSLRRAIESSPHDILLRFIDRVDESEDAELTAVTNLLDGKTEQAIASLLVLEKQKPGSYTLATNLGTAYELHGDNQNALKWICEGIKRNPESHHGTEWLHQLILETKIEFEKDSHLLQQQQLITLPEEFDENTLVRIGNQERKISEIRLALAYQLGERLVFVKPTDPLVANLLFSYARITARTGTVEDGLEVLKISKEYGFQDTVRLETLQGKYQRIIFIRQLKKYGLIAAGVTLFVIILIWMYRKKWFFMSRKDYEKHQDLTD